MAKAYTQDAFEAACERVYAAIDLEVLKGRCQQSKKSLFIDLGSRGGKFYGPRHERHAFLNQNAPIIAVAHLDTVQQDTTFGSLDYPDETLIFNPRLDDRLGVYTILDLLPQLGIVTDILLSDNEEQGRTTAANFKSKKKYNWIVSFDRRGEDVVTYQYTWDATLRDYFTVGHGSFSCIGKMNGLGCQAMNIGVGYHDEHSQRAFFVLEEYIRNLARFLLFHEQYRGQHFAYTKPVWDRHDWRGRGCGANDSRLSHANRMVQERNGVTPPVPEVRDKPKQLVAPPIIRDSREELMRALPHAIAFCEYCWKALDINMLHSINDHVLWSGMCTTCGFITEITGLVADAPSS